MNGGVRRVERPDLIWFCPESCLRHSDGDLKITPKTRGHRYSLAARGMREVFGDYARRHSDEKRTDWEFAAVGLR